MSTRRDSIVRREVMRFAIPGLVALALLAGGSLWLGNQVARAESVRDAVVNAQLLARLIIQPRLTQDLTGGDPAALADLDGAVRREVLATPVVTVRLWDEDGTIVYSDRPELVGQRFGLGSDEREVLAEGGVAAEVSDLTKPENRFEAGLGELVEVYLPVTTADGDTYLFEVYQRQETLDEDARRVWFAFVPVLLGSLAVLAIILLTLATRMARRLDGERRQREALLERAIDASEVERRRIAADLHDGVVQDLAGVSFTLAGLGSRASAAGDTTTASDLERTASRTRDAVGSLRSLLVDIYPPNLVEAGLAAAILDLGKRLPAQVQVEVGDTSDVAPDVLAGVYRAAREALLNVSKHADAEHVWVTVTRDPGALTLTVRDDGRGFVPSDVGDGHFGLALLRDLAVSMGGSVEVTSAPGAGTTVEFRVGIAS